MSFMGTLAQFDILGVGVLVGSILLLAGFVWVLVGAREFEHLGSSRVEPEEGAVLESSPRPQTLEAPVAGVIDGTSTGGPKRPSRTGRAA